MKRQSLSNLAAVAVCLALLAQPLSAQVSDYRDIQYPTLKEFNIPEPAVYSLKNGLTVFLLEDHELPLIEVFARIRTGSVYEPAEKVGLASIAGEVLRTGGTTRMTGDEIDDYLAARAAEIETSIGSTSGFASMDCLKEDFDDVFQVLAEILRSPVFDEEKLEVTKVQSSSLIARRNDDINGITSREFQRLIYGLESPLSRLEEYATIDAIGREDLVAWHKKYYHPNNIYLGVVGDFDAKAMRKKIQTVFGDWPKGPAFSEAEVSYQREMRAGVFFIEKSDVNQANIAMGHLGIETQNPDYFAIQVLNEVFGGSFASRLFSNIRTKKGLAYSVRGAIGSSVEYPGIFRAGLQTKSESMAEAVEALQEEIRGLISSPPSQAEIQRAKESLLNSFIFNYDSTGKILSQQMYYAFYGLPSDFLEKYRNNIEKVTAEDLTSVAEKYLHPDKLTLLVVGKAEDFDRPVETFGQVSTLDITIPPPPDTSPRVEKTAAALEAGKSLLARMAEAIGGSSGETVKAVRSQGTMVVQMGGQSMQMARTDLLVFPDKLRQTLQTPMGEQVVVLTRDEGFMFMGGQSRALPADAVAQQQTNLKRELRMLAESHDDPEMEALAAGEEEVEGTVCQIVAVSFRGAESRLWVDAEGRVLKQAYQGNHPMTQVPGQFEVFYSDYREVDGRQVPFKRVVKIEGEEVITLTLDSFEFNPEVEATAFEKPAA